MTTIALEVEHRRGNRNAGVLAPRGSGIAPREAHGAAPEGGRGPRGVEAGAVPTKGPGAERILAAWRVARTAQADYAIKALICGQLMLEQRAAMMLSEAPTTWHSKAKPEANNFTRWLEKHCPQVCRDTAYRWMAAADRVARRQLGLGVGEPMPMAIEVESSGNGREPTANSQRVPLSMALTAPEKELSKEALKFRQGVFEFMADRTLSDALNAALDGESPAHRISRAAAGKHDGGAGTTDRKAVEHFAALKLRHITTLLRQKVSATQKALIVAAFTRALHVWPRWLLEGIAEKTREELKLSEEQRAARMEF